jgi:hypothetical protein
MCMDDLDAFRVEHGRKVTFLDCHRRFLPMNHAVWGDMQSLLKAKTGKGLPK